MKTIAVIPARAGSKRIPSKNTKILGNKPLIQWTIDAAKNVRNIDDILVSTDCPKIKELLRDEKRIICLDRPSKLATDEASTMDVLFHVLDNQTKTNDGDLIVLLQPTSPLRSAAQIENAIQAFNPNKHDSLVSVKATSENPFHTYYVSESNIFPVADKKFLLQRTQDHPKTLLLNGAIYIASKGYLNTNKSFVGDKLGFYEMDEISSIDIDELEDFERAEKAIKGI